MKKMIIAVFAAFALAGCVNDIEQIVSGKKTSAVVIGVENGFAGRCDGALKDAADMKMLLSRYSSDIAVLTDSRASSAAVISAMKDAVKADLAIIYFSGHGGSSPSSDAFETDGRDEYICCYDGAVVDNRIWEIVSGAKGRVFLIFDCCHSETMFRSPGIMMKRTLAAGFAKSRSVTGVLCWSGCPDDSYSYGSSSGGEFTKVLRRYALAGGTYAEVWKNISGDPGLAAQQDVKSTEIGNFGSWRAKIFR